MNPIAIFRFAPPEGPGFLAEFLDARAIPWQLVAIDEGDTVPPTAAAYCGLVFMGGPMSVNDDLPWIAEVTALIRDAVANDIPVLGHCLGGQLISKALGGVVSRNSVVVREANVLTGAPHPNPLPPAGEGANESLREIYVKEIGWGEVRVTDNDTARAWFGEAASFDAFHWHGETFTLPPSAVHLLSSAHCTNQAYAIGKHLALQCHVEMTAEMIASWCEIGADEIAASLTSPAVQTADEMQRQAEKKLPQLNRVAERLYGHWIAGLRGSD